MLSVSGSITFEETIRLAEKWFGPIPRREISPRRYQSEPMQTEERWAEASGNVPQVAVVRAFKMPAYGEKNYIECDIITDLLASGRSSRFYRNLLMKTGLFTEVDASIIGSDEPGFMMFNAKLTGEDDVSVEKSIEAMMGEAQKLIDGDVSEYELTRTINRFESNFLFSSMGFMAKAQSLANHEMHSEDINGIVERYRSVTTDDIARVAREIFNPQHTSTLVYRPQK